MKLKTNFHFSRTKLLKLMQAVRTSRGQCYKIVNKNSYMCCVK